ncbi:hypothetical protein [Metabacillus malikii]|uniref:WXG100 family type VII secretion target n=1 Tax=Metabacillus malikii TaxID=1504265 RepID=A0ABT9ZMU5_9BACI|nr:hypothetical protein [Metabacillus malikii]MDQ0233137.1 hypothetical protein [Metabacillus malikii]
MRVDRRDIWMNLCQLESGINNNVPKAIRITKNEPFSLAFWDDPTDEEKEKSRSNKAKLDYIRGEISSTQTILDRKMDALWNIFDNKIVPYENTDDAYNNKAAAVKAKYTNLFEWVKDDINKIDRVINKVTNQIVVGIHDFILKMTTIVIESGIVSVSLHIPDIIEPSILKENAERIVTRYNEGVFNILNDPMIIMESMVQTGLDLVEKENGIFVVGDFPYPLTPNYMKDISIKDIADIRPSKSKKESNDSLEVTELLNYKYKKEFSESGVLGTTGIGNYDSLFEANLSGVKIKNGVSLVDTNKALKVNGLKDEKYFQKLFYADGQVVLPVLDFTDSFISGSLIGGKAEAAVSHSRLAHENSPARLDMKFLHGETVAGIENYTASVGAKVSATTAEISVNPLNWFGYEPLEEWFGLEWDPYIGVEASLGSIGASAKVGLNNELYAAYGIGIGLKFGAEKDEEKE